MSSAKLTPAQRSEIMTPLPVVRQMCNLCEPLLSDPCHKVFEPGCGTSNFLAETLERRLRYVKDRLRHAENTHAALIALSNLYGVDTNLEYIAASRSRLRALVLDHFAGQNLDYRFLPLIDLFLNSNLIQADFLHHHEQLIFVDWRPLSEYSFRAVPTSLADMLESNHA